MKSCFLSFRRLRLFLPLAFCAGIGALLPNVSRADQALVVGVNEYPHLRPDSNLGGCANDADRMAAALKKYKFTVTMLKDHDATHQGIMNALGKFKSIGPGERFVFYFAGHGTHASNGESVLLPHDAEDGAETHDIRNDELFQALQSIPAKSRTALLDSCFSGGMVHTRGLLKLGLKSRYYQRSSVRKNLQAHAKRFEEVPINKQDDVDDKTKTTGICYYAACMKNEVSYEMTQPNGGVGGVFTAHLTELLNGKREIWSNLSSVINQQVAQDTEDLQRPLLSPAYLQKIVFEDADGTDKKKNTLADIYYTSNPDPKKVTITMNPNVSPLLLLQKIQFEVKAGTDGYMLVLGRDQQGDIYIISPHDDKTDTNYEDKPIKVSAGTTIRIPTKAGKILQAMNLGTERVKVILFKDRAAADKMLAEIRKASAVEGGSQRGSMSKKLQEVDIDTAPFYTAELMVEVVAAN